jgi:hypothetical protein
MAIGPGRLLERRARPQHPPVGPRCGDDPEPTGSPWAGNLSGIDSAAQPINEISVR